MFHSFCEINYSLIFLSAHKKAFHLRSLPYGRKTRQVSYSLLQLGFSSFVLIAIIFFLFVFCGRFQLALQPVHEHIFKYMWFCLNLCSDGVLAKRDIDMSLAKSNLFDFCSVPWEPSPPFIHYPIFNHFSPALYIVFIHEQ